MLGTVDAAYAAARIRGIDAQIAEHRAVIKRLEKRKAVLKGAAVVNTDDTDDAAGAPAND